MAHKQLTEHHLEFLSLKGGCTGSFEFIHVKYHIDGNHMMWLKYVPTPGLPGHYLFAYKHDKFRSLYDRLFNFRIIYPNV